MIHTGRLVGLAVLLALLAVPGEAQIDRCMRCITWCAPGSWFCEYACEEVQGFCSNCWSDCAASTDICGGRRVCYWTSLPAPAPFLQAAAPSCSLL